MSGGGKRGAGDSSQNGEEDGGEEFKDVDADVTDEQLDEAVEAFIDAMWARAEEQFNNSRPVGKDRVDPFAEEKWDKIEGELEESQDALRKRYNDLKTPRPSAFKPLIESTEKVAMALGTADVSDFEPGDEPTRLGGNDDFLLLSTAADYMAGWRGDMKYALMENYLSPFPGILATQGSIAKTLRNTARLLQFIFERRRSDAKKLAEEATVAVESAGGGSNGILFMILGIVGATIPVAGTVSSAVVGAMASTASALGGELAGEEEEVPLSAGSVQGVVDNLFSALDKSDETMREDEEKILELLQSIEKLVAPLADYMDDTKTTELIPMNPFVSLDEDITELLKPKD